MIPTKNPDAQASLSAQGDFLQLGQISARITSRQANGIAAVTTGNVQQQAPAVTAAEYTAAVTPAGIATNRVIAAALGQSDTAKLAAALAALE